MPKENLIGGEEGHGFKQVMTGLEAERLNVAARGLGVARAAFEEAIKYAQQRQTFGKPIAQHQTIQIKLAEMATRIEASRLLIYSAAAKKDRRERCDVEAGMAKLFATETAAEVSLEAMRIMGGNGFSKDFPVERFYRDAPLLLIGGGSNEIQRLIIARGLLERYKVHQWHHVAASTSADRSDCYPNSSSGRAPPRPRTRASRDRRLRHDWRRPRRRVRAGRADRPRHGRRRRAAATAGSSAPATAPARPTRRSPTASRPTPSTSTTCASSRWRIQAARWCPPRWPRRNWPTRPDARCSTRTSSASRSSAGSAW